jgi:hypothetical protein
VVERIQINVREELARQVADRHTPARTLAAVCHEGGQEIERVFQMCRLFFGQKSWNGTSRARGVAIERALEKSRQGHEPCHPIGAGSASVKAARTGRRASVFPARTTSPVPTAGEGMRRAGALDKPSLSRF